MAKTYFIKTYGCQMNEHDSERMAGLLEAAGYSEASGPEEAAVVVFNTCAIREKADNKLYGNLGAMKALKEQRPELKVLVGGCLAEKDREGIAERAPWISGVFGTRNIEVLPSLIAQAEMQSVPLVEFAEHLTVFPSALPLRRLSPFHSWIAIQYGCNNSCTFCIVPSVRGVETSRRVGDILAEVRNAVDDGVVEVTLLGQNVNSYGRDIYGKPRFADLLLALDDIDGLRRVRYTSPHPKDFREPVARAMADSKVVCEHLHLPVQSGSDRVLKAMKRTYTRDKYLCKVEMARALIDGLAVTTDIIVGFPGETEEDFEQTLELARDVGFDSAYTFQYSPRPGTVAASMEDQIPKEIVQERFGRLVQVCEESAQRINFALVGTTLEVLNEGASKRDSTRKTGRTRTNKVVHYASNEPPGAFETVLMQRATPHFLEGTLSQ